MVRSIITNDLKHCFVCGTTNNIQYHHVIYGKNRKISDQDGLIVPLCIFHHTGSNYGVHGKLGHKLDIELKKKAQEKWQEYYQKTVDDFIKRYGKSYL